MARRRTRDPLSMDIAADLERVDSVMTQILKDRALWNEFLRDPSGVFIRLGLHPPTTTEISERVNRAFYATLTNRKLLRFVIDQYRDFRVSKKKQFGDEVVANLKKGELQHPIELDLEAAEHLFRDSKALGQVLRLALEDLNRKGILDQRYSRRAIDDYVDSVVAAVEARLPAGDQPVLEAWDRNYGVGQRFGAGIVETAVVATSAVAVEVGGVVTSVAVAVAHVVAAVEVEVIGPDILTARLAGAAEGDLESIRAAAILGRLLDLSGELLVHAHTFEARSRS